MTKLFYAIILIVLFSIATLYGQCYATEDLSLCTSGSIRINLHSFPYRQDPEGVDYSSRGYLGDVSAYVLRVYASKQMKIFIDAAKSSEEIFGEGNLDNVTIYPDGKNYGGVLVKEAKSLLGERLRPQVEGIFAKGGRLEIVIPGKSAPLFVDIPAPEGTYYVEYSLLFLQARNSDTKVHPNYRHQSRDDSSILWGPPKVEVKAGMIANVDFRPTHNIAFYKYPDSKKGYFESSRGFWDWMKFLLWAGVIYK